MMTPWDHLRPTSYQVHATNLTSVLVDLRNTDVRTIFSNGLQIVEMNLSGVGQEEMRWLTLEYRFLCRLWDRDADSVFLNWHLHRLFTVVTVQSFLEQVN